MPLDDIYKGYREATRGLEAQSSAERDRVMSEYNTQRREIADAAARSERDVQQALGRVRTAERREQRRADLPTSKPRDIQARQRLAEIRQQGEAIQRQLSDARQRVEQARGESVRDLEQQVKTAQRELDNWRRDAVREVKATQRAARAAQQAARTAKPTAQELAEKSQASEEISMSSFPEMRTTPTQQKAVKQLADVMKEVNAQVAGQQAFAGAKARVGVASSGKSIAGIPLTGAQKTLANMSQRELKSLYEGETVLLSPAEQMLTGVKQAVAKASDVPKWYRLIKASVAPTPVQKDKAGNYSAVVAGYAPAIATAARPTARLKTITAERPAYREIFPSSRIEDVIDIEGVVKAVINRAKSKAAETFRPDFVLRRGYEGSAEAAREAELIFRGSANLKIDPKLAAQIRAADAARRAARETQTAVRFTQAIKPATQLTNTTVRVVPAAISTVKRAAAINPHVAASVIATLGLQTAVNAAQSGATMPQIRQATQVAVRQMAQTIPDSRVNVQQVTRVTLQEFERLQADAASKVATKIQTEIVPGITTKTISSTVPSIAPVEATATKAAIQPATKTQTATKTTTEVPTKTTTETTPRPPTPGPTPIPLPKIPLKLPGGESVSLTREQYAGIVAWKQGLFYILVYPPYGKAQTIYTRKPVAGIQYGSGPGSPQRTARVVGGKLPKAFELAMGVTKVKVRPGLTKGKPRLKFRSREVVTPQLGEVRRSKRRSK